MKLISSGDTNGVFQLESEGMKGFMKKLQPTCFEDIIAEVALYRPGPMEYIDDYIREKHDPGSIKYLTPELENHFKLHLRGDRLSGCDAFSTEKVEQNHKVI